jgi:hypothetical protein
MGEAKRKRSRTQALIEQYPKCALCGGSRPSTTRDHIPPVALFDNAHRPDGLVTPACHECNSTASTADLVASIISRWRYDIGQKEGVDHGRLLHRLNKQAPELIAEWTKLSPEERKMGREHLEKHGVHAPEDAGVVSIGPITIPYLNFFAYKMLLGLYFNHMGSFVPASGLMYATWRTKEDFQQGGVPKEVIQMLPERGNLQQGKWNTSEQFEYRFNRNPEDGVFGYIARLRAGLFTIGYAVAKSDSLFKDDAKDWISPTALLEVLKDERFKKRLI